MTTSFLVSGSIAFVPLAIALLAAGAGPPSRVGTAFRVGLSAALPLLCAAPGLAVFGSRTFRSLGVILTLMLGLLIQGPCAPTAAGLSYANILAQLCCMASCTLFSISALEQSR